MKKDSIYLELFTSFFKIGSMAIGGGYVMLPMIQREVVEVKKWCSEDEVYDFYTLGQSLPGMISVNTATLIGYQLKGLPGAIAATAGMIMPSLIIIMFIAAFFGQIQENPVIQRAFKGIRAAVVATIAMAVIKMAKKSIVNVFGIVLATASFICFYFLKISPFYIVIGAGVMGMIYASIERRKEI